MRSLPPVRAAGASPVRTVRARRALAAAALLAVTLAGAPLGAQDPATASPAAGRARPTPAPDPRLAPDEVVGIVLDAFAHVRGDAAPLEVAYAFTAPANRAAIGSVDRFVDVVRDGSHSALLGHRRAVRGAIRLDGDQATQRVVVTTADGGRVVYTFRLTRQGDGAYKDCWMTERVTREPPSRLAAPPLAAAPRAAGAGVTAVAAAG